MTVAGSDGPRVARVHCARQRALVRAHDALWIGALLDVGKQPRFEARTPDLLLLLLLNAGITDLRGPGAEKIHVPAKRVPELREPV